MLALTGQGGSVFQSRALADNGTASTDGPLAKLPHWLKLVRNHDLFSGYVSANGTNWTAAGSVTVPMGKTLQAGLAVTAHNNSVLNSALFESVTVSQPAERPVAGGKAGKGN